jgi:hypothetical protein
MFELLAVCLSLAGFLVTGILGSLLVAGIWRFCASAAENWTPSVRARFLFLLRIAPCLGAILSVGGLFLPAYLSHEPRQTTEIVTAKLGVLAAISLYGILFALWRAGSTCLATRRLMRSWLAHAQAVKIPGISVPTFRIRHPFPVIAIVGALHPRMFVADQVFDSLHTDEITAAIAHERAHLSAFDNLKRGILRLSRDFICFMPVGRSLDRAWAEAVEFAADDDAAQRGSAVALDLASALVKVARLVPDDGRRALLAGVTLIAADHASIHMRVLRLTRLASGVRPVPRQGRRAPGVALAACISGVTIAWVLLLISSDLLVLVHTALECVVSALQ